MKQLRTISIMTAAAALTLALTAQEAPKGKRSRQQDTVQQEPVSPQRQPPPRFPRNQFVAPSSVDRPPVNEREGRTGTRLHPYGARAGDWLRQYKDVPVDQQERALTNDPSFQRLPAERQEKLRERLRQFNSLSPEMKDRLLDRMEKFETLPPEQRQRLQGIQERMRQLPEDRQQKVRRAFHQLKGMSPEQRQAYLGSERFQTIFNQEEREIIRVLTDIEGTPELAEPGDPREND